MSRAAVRGARGRGRSEASCWKARAGDAGRRIDGMDKRETALAEEAEAIAGRPEKLLAEIATLEDEHARARTRPDELLAAETRAGEAVRLTEEQARIAGEALAQAREERAGAVAREIGKACGRARMCKEG